MLRTHQEGRSLLMAAAVGLVVLNAFIAYQFPSLLYLCLLASGVFYALLWQFFRNPDRSLSPETRSVFAPADGKIVVIEEVFEKEYFQDKRIQVSIFMSPFNVHVNRNPVSGIIRYFRYHPGRFLVAWHPKSSEENERTTVVYDTGRAQVMIRQIAGAMANRIKWYVKEGETVTQGADMGFIKFGSRVDVFLPLDVDLKIKIGQVIRANRTVLAELPA